MQEDKMMAHIILCSLFFGILFHPRVALGNEDIFREGSMRDWFYNSYQVRGPSLTWTPPTAEKPQSETRTSRSTADVWLVTKSVDIINKTNVHVLYVNMQYNGVSCVRNISCNLTIYVYNGSHFDIPSTPKDFKPFLYNNFALVHNITFATNKTKARFNFSYSGQLVTFGIRARAMRTASISYMKMFYYYCKETFIESIYFPKTISSPNQSKVINGNCSENSIPSKNGTKAFCLENGNWSLSNGSECLCVYGFQPNSSMGCQSCMANYYKSTTSNDLCAKCPKGNKDRNFTGCMCEDGKYRSSGIETYEPCFGIPSKVLNLKVENETRSSIILKWKKPSESGGANETFLTYNVTCYYCSSSEFSNCTDICKLAKYNPEQHHNLSSTSVIISNLKPKYVKFKVFSKNTILKGVDIPWMYEELTHTLKSGNREPGETDGRKLVIISSVVALFLIIVVIILIIVIISKRKQRRPAQGDNNAAYEGLTLPTLGQKVYIDPLNYDDPEAAVKDFAHEIDAKALNLERVLGGGEFGDVYKGLLSCADGSTILVAAKTLKHDSDEKSRKDFFMEASAMGQFDDPNVICLEGIITKTKPYMIITEYMSNGSLDNFLKQNEEQLTDLQMIGMARGVASGMKYLAALRFVHRDLAARNILINETLVCKVADFGLSRELETADSSRGEYFTTGGKIPVRWTAPEAIKYRKFSTASDVWSYGILLWEIMTFSERPYWDWDNFKVMERVDEGFRLPLPMKCPKVVHLLMLQCWEKARNDRPQFADIVVLMDEWIRSPETIRDSKLSRNSIRDSKLSRNSMLPEMVNEPSIPIKEWLNTIKLNTYMPHFAAAGYKEMSQLAGLLDNDLKDLGITLIGHRNKMLRTIRSLPITHENHDMKHDKSIRI